MVTHVPTENEIFLFKKVNQNEMNNVSVHFFLARSHSHSDVPQQNGCKVSNYFMKSVELKADGYKSNPDWKPTTTHSVR